MVDFDGDGSLEQSDGENDPVTAFEINENSFEPAKTAVSHADALTEFDIGPRLAGRFGGHGHLQLENFRVGDRDGGSSVSDNLHNAGRHNEGATRFEFEPAKQIAGKERLFELFDSVGPLS